MRKSMAVLLLSIIVVLSGFSPVSLLTGQLTSTVSAEGGGE
jgi:hypothetical protein